MSNLKIDDSISRDLRKSAGWIKFLSILLFVGMGLIILTSLVGLITSIVKLTKDYDYLTRAAEDVARNAAMVGVIVSLLFGVIGSLCTYFPGMYGMRFSSKIVNGLENANQQYIQEAFRSLGSWFKFWGIFWIVYIVLWIIYITVMLAIGAA